MTGLCITHAFETAEILGHVLENDPPHALSSAQRWSCTTCGRAVIRCNGNVYGSALDVPCTKQPGR